MSPGTFFASATWQEVGHPPASGGQLSTAGRPEGQWDRATRLPCLSSFKDQNRDVDP